MVFFKVDNLKVYYPIRGGIFKRVVDNVKAVDGISLEMKQGETYGLVGESGCGKSTTGKAILDLTKQTAGKIIFQDQDLTKLSRRQMHQYRKKIQIIFQDPYSSLNIKKRVLDIVAEPMRNFEKLSKKEVIEKVQYFLGKVGLDAEAIYKYPHEFSGGQRQRIGIARAISLNPQLIVADEPVSALDVSVQAQVLNFFQDVQKEFNLSYLFISHDLGVIRHMCDRIGIMFNGQLVEEGTSEEIYQNPKHIYTKKLIAAIPETKPRERDRIIQFRNEVAEEYEKSFHQYFTEDGSAYPLKPISANHSVAMP